MGTQDTMPAKFTDIEVKFCIVEP